MLKLVAQTLVGGGGDWKLLALVLFGVAVLLAITVRTVRANARKGEALRRRIGDETPGRFRVEGVNTLTATREVKYITADSNSNARAKGKLLGIEVTTVDQA